MDKYDDLIYRWRKSEQPSFMKWLDENPEELDTMKPVENVIIHLDDEEIDECKHFAAARLSGSKALYQRRNGGSTEKIMSDIVAGAMGEIAIYKYFKSLGYNISQPDFNVYSKRSKSFDADMTIGHIEIHCKTQCWDSRKRYGNSWILQNSETQGQDKLFRNRDDGDYIAMAGINADDTVTILGVMPLKLIFDNDLIGECKVEWLRRHKSALYLKDLEPYGLFHLPEKEK